MSVLLDINAGGDDAYGDSDAGYGGGNGGNGGGKNGGNGGGHDGNNGGNGGSNGGNGKGYGSYGAWCALVRPASVEDVPAVVDVAARNVSVVHLARLSLHCTSSHNAY